MDNRGARQRGSMETKICKKCGEEKDVKLFSKPTDRKHPRNYCRACDAASTKAWAAANPEKNRRRARRTMLRSKYNLTLEEYDTILASQGFCCAICKTTETRNKYGHFVVDHDHRTGQVRGLLCDACNIGLGGFRDNPVSLEAAIRYLLDHTEAKG